MRAALEPLSKLVGLPRNPKLHNLGDIHQSIKRFGFVKRNIVNDTTNHVIAGNGRIETLRQQKLSNEPAPAGIEVRPDDWYVPTDHISVPEDEEEALAIALNRIGENEWDDIKTSKILSDLAAQDKLDGTGYDGDDVDSLLKKIAPRGMGNVTKEDMDAYNEEKSHWRWIRLNIKEEVYEHWQEVKSSASSIKDDNEFVEFLLNLVSKELLEIL